MFLQNFGAIQVQRFMSYRV